MTYSIWVCPQSGYTNMRYLSICIILVESDSPFCKGHILQFPGFTRDRTHLGVGLGWTMLLCLPWVRHRGALMEVFHSNKAKPKKAWYDVNLDCCPWHSNRHVLDPRHQVVSISPGSSRSDEAVLAPEILWPFNTFCIYIHKYRCMYRPHLISHHIRTYTVYIYTYIQLINYIYILQCICVYIYVYIYMYIYITYDMYVLDIHYLTVSICSTCLYVWVSLKILDTTQWQLQEMMKNQPTWVSYFQTNRGYVFIVKHRF